MSRNGKTLKFRAAKLKGFTVFHRCIHRWGTIIHEDYDKNMPNI